MTVPDHPNADVLNSEDFTVEELRAAAFGQGGRLSQDLALALLGRKSYPQKLQDLEQVLADAAQTPKIRHNAATELGRMGTAEARRALRAHAGTADPFVRRGVERALLAMEATAAGGLIQPSQATGAEVEWAARLAAYRQGLPGLEMPRVEAGRLLPVAAERTIPVRLEPLPSSVLGTLLATVAKRLPGMALSPARATRLECGPRVLALALAEEFARPQAIARLRRAKAMVAVVAEHYPQEGDFWSPKYLVLTQPSGERDRLDIFLTTSKGALVLAGSAQISGQAARFTLRAVERRGAVPVEIDGTYENGEVRLERAVSAVRAASQGVPRERKRRA